MNIAEMYYYVFYKYYKLCTTLNPKGWTPDMIAVLIMMNLLGCLFFPIQFYYDIFSGTRSALTFFSFKVLGSLSLVFLLQWIAFWRNDDWKKYVEKFDQWPEEKNVKGGWIVAVITIILLANFIIPFALDPPSGGWK